MGPRQNDRSGKPKLFGYDNYRPLHEENKMTNQTGPRGLGDFVRSADGTWNVLPIVAVVVLIVAGGYYFFGGLFNNRSNPVPNPISQDVPKDTQTR
jgi:hypothetical protein